jgi:hypothetical protein
MRNISFMLTTEQFKNRTKTVTRRVGWAKLKPGDVLMGCVKCQGLGKGGKIETLGPIRVVSVRRERLDAITGDDCVKEGFPAFQQQPEIFVEMFCRHMKTWPAQVVTRIEYKYLEAKG